MCVCCVVSIQLQFEKGEVITVTRIVDGGWWEGVCDGRSGWFPGNYVERATGKMCMRCIYYYVHGVCGCGGVCVCWYGGGGGGGIHVCVYMYVYSKYMYVVYIMRTCTYACAYILVCVFFSYWGGVYIHTCMYM